MKKLILKRIEESISTKKKVIHNNRILELIAKISLSIIEGLKNHHKVIFAGNGGSFSDSFHLDGEFVSRFMFDRVPLPAIALGGNNSILTAVGNDYSFHNIFSRELEALGETGDILIAISTSGSSKNIIKAIETANKKGVRTFGFTGKDGGEMKDICECIRVPSDNTARIQEVHIMIGHIICEIVEKKIFN